MIKIPVDSFGMIRCESESNKLNTLHQMHKGSILPLSLLLLAHVPLQKWFGIVHLKKKKK